MEIGQVENRCKTSEKMLDADIANLGFYLDLVDAHWPYEPRHSHRKTCLMPAEWLMSTRLITGQALTTTSESSYRRNFRVSLRVPNMGMRTSWPDPKSPDLEVQNSHSVKDN